MQTETLEQLRAINRRFYRDFAADFAASRQRPWPGFERLRTYLPDPCRLLDVGCGDGRLGRYLFAHSAIVSYTGVDFSAPLLQSARLHAAGPDADNPTRAITFVERDLSDPQALAGLAHFDAVACLATLQHIPGRARRVALLQQMAECLAPGGALILANWQFPDSPRQQRKIIPWERVGIAPSDVEAGDYLVAWRRGGEGVRYVAHLDAAATDELLAAAGLELIAHFRSDGREGNLNLYTVARHPTSRRSNKPPGGDMHEPSPINKPPGGDTREPLPITQPPGGDTREPLPINKPPGGDTIP